ERAVWPRFNRRGTKPRIARPQKFATLLIWCAMRTERNAVRLENFAMNHVVDRFADENRFFKTAAEKRIAIRLKTAGGGNMPRHAHIIESLLHPRDRKDAT